MMSRVHVVAIAGVMLASWLSWGGQITLGQNMLWFYRGDGGDPFRAGVDFATTDNPWKPEVITELQPFACLRMLDWTCATFINLDHTWMDRRQKTSQNQDCTWEYGDNGVAYEWQIDLCNRTGCALWAFVPCLTVSAADRGRLPDYPLRLALLIKTGVDTRTVSLSGMNLETVTAGQLVAAGGVQTSQPLASHLRVIVEYGDEVNWDRFAEYVQAEGAKLGLSGDGFYAWASMKCIAAFDAVFGRQSARFYRLMSGQAGWYQRMVNHMVTYRNTAYNEDSVKLDGYAIAPYFNGRTWDDLQASIDRMAVVDSTSEIGKHKRMCNRLGIELICYEIGQDQSPVDWSIQRDVRMYDTYRRYLDTVVLTWFNGVCCHYGYAGAGSWGSKEYVGQPAAQAPKYRALLDWMSAHPVGVRSALTAAPSPAVQQANAHALRVLSGRGETRGQDLDLSGRVVGFLEGASGGAVGGGAHVLPVVR